MCSTKCKSAAQSVKRLSSGQTSFWPLPPLVRGPTRKALCVWKVFGRIYRIVNQNFWCAWKVFARNYKITQKIANMKKTFLTWSFCIFRAFEPRLHWQRLKLEVNYAAISKEDLTHQNKLIFEKLHTTYPLPSRSPSFWKQILQIFGKTSTFV